MTDSGRRSDSRQEMPMTDPSRYQRTADPSTSRRGVPRAVWVVATAVLLVVLVVVVVLLVGGHDPSQFQHG